MRMRFALLFLAAALSTASAPPPQYKVVAQIPAGDGGWDLASVSSEDQRLYVARSDGITAIDLKTGKATDHLVPAQRGHAALAIPGSHLVISTNGETNNALLFDGRTGAVKATIPTGKKPDAAAFDRATKTVWVMDPGSGEITVIDPANAKVLDTINVGGSLEFGVADGRGRMYVNLEDKNELVVLDTRSRKLVGRYPLKGCDGPTGIAFDAAAGQVLSACGGNAVAVVSAFDGHEVASIPIGKGADGAVFDRKRGIAIVPAGRDGNVTLIRLGTAPKVVGQVATAVSARTIALDDATGRAYLPSATLAPAVGSERPKPLPGTFRVIVLAP